MFKFLKNIQGGGKNPVKLNSYRNIAISLCLILFMSFTIFVSSVSVKAKTQRSSKRAATSGANKRAAASGANKRAAASGSNKRAASASARAKNKRVMSRVKSGTPVPAEETKESEIAEVKEVVAEVTPLDKTSFKKCPVEKALGKKVDENGNELYYTSKNKSGEEFCDDTGLENLAEVYEWSESVKSKYPKGNLSSSDNIHYFKCNEGYVVKNDSDGIRSCVSICPLNVVLGKGSSEGQYILPETGDICDVPANSTGRLARSGENTRGDLDDASAYIVECNANKYSAVLEDSSSVHYQCLSCPVGYVSAVGSKSKDECREECKAGQMTLADGSCVTCDSNASLVKNACVCKDGYYGAGHGDEGCQACPEGYVCSGGEKKTKYAQEEVSNQQKSCPQGAKVTSDGSSCECIDSQYTFNITANKCELSSCKSGEILKDGKCITECKAGSYRNSSGTCVECAFGTYTTESEQTSCKKCPSGYICPTTSIALNSLSRVTYCKSVLVKSVDTNGSGSGSLSKGIYKIQVAGAGGGGGGGIKLCGACSTSKYDSGRGGNGDLQISSYIHVADSLSYSYTIGKGGNGSGRASCKSDGKYGDNGGSSSFTSSLTTFVAEGGKGGRSVYGKMTSCHDGNSGSDAGNGEGGKGGSKRNGGNDSGNSGANGWLKIYQFVCDENKLKSSSSTTVVYSGGGCR